MAKLSWKESDELRGIAAIIGSLELVGLQLKQAQDIALAETRCVNSCSTVL